MKLNKLYFPFLMLACLCLLQCTNNTPAAEEEGDSMAKLTKDEEFKNAHETPEGIAFKGKGAMKEFPTSDGKMGKAYALSPKTESNKYLFVVHEWWGLNDHIKREAERLFDELRNVNVMALDLYDGNVTDDRDEAGKFMQAVKPERCEAIIKGALDVAGDDGKVTTIGWCFGGGWSLRSSILAGEKGAGCVMYYGIPVEKAAELAPLKADVLGIFAKKDKWINDEVIGKFEGLTKATGKNFDVHWFEADHAFANPSSPRYNEAAAQEANGLTLAFLRKKLEIEN